MDLSSLIINVAPPSNQEKLNKRRAAFNWVNMVLELLVAELMWTEVFNRVETRDYKDVKRLHRQTDSNIRNLGWPKLLICVWDQQIFCFSVLGFTKLHCNKLLTSETIAKPAVIQYLLCLASFFSAVEPDKNKLGVLDTTGTIETMQTIASADKESGFLEVTVREGGLRSSRGNACSIVSIVGC